MKPDMIGFGELIKKDDFEVKEYLKWYPVETPEEAFELSILKWAFLASGVSDDGDYAYNEIGAKISTCGLCKLAGGCNRCLIGREAKTCFKEFYKWSQSGSSEQAMEVLLRIIREYNDYLKSNEPQNVKKLSKICLTCEHFIWMKGICFKTEEPVAAHVQTCDQWKINHRMVKE